MGKLKRTQRSVIRIRGSFDVGEGLSLEVIDHPVEVSNGLTY